MKQSRLARIGVTGAALLGVAALALTSASAANADPSPTPTPGAPASYRTYAAVGSDTIQDVYNALTNGTGAVSPDIASWNAFPLGSTIVTKNGGPTFARPSGSGNGVLALSKSKNTAGDRLFSNGSGGTVNIADQVDIARSSSGPAAAGTALAYIPFARDAVSFAVKLPSGTASTVSATLTATQLNEIYSCTTTSVTLSDSTVLAVTPKLPQSGSGTRSFFLNAIGNPALGSCVNAASNIPDNNGSAALKSAGDLIPFSSAQWIAQKNLVQTPNTVQDGSIRIGNILSGSTTLFPTAGSGTALTPGTLYGSAAAAPAPGTGIFARDTYSVILNSQVGTASPCGIEAAVTTKFTTTPATATISKYGFLNLSYLSTLDRGQYKFAAFTG